MSPPPVSPGAFPDPFVLAVGRDYYAYGSNGGGSNVRVITSSDLGTWRTLPDGLPELPGWSRPNFTWSPAVLPRPGGYVLYYAVRAARGDRQAISVAASAHPGGPFTDTSAGPLIYQQAQGGSIDPSPFVDADGLAYLLWKEDANAIGQPSSLWIQQLTSDGLGLVGEATALLRYDAAWENPLIEAPSLVLDDGTYYLFYSANWWNTPRYAIGYATAAHVLGPYRKVTTAGPWFAADAQVAGPGGQEWFVDGRGQRHMAYHGWPPGQVAVPGGPGRSLRTVAVTFSSGRPEVTA
jgi:beta-xylosidase